MRTHGCSLRIQHQFRHEWEQNWKMRMSRLEVGSWVSAQCLQLVRWAQRPKEALELWVLARRHLVLKRGPLFFLGGYLAIFGDFFFFFGCYNPEEVLGSRQGLQLTYYNTQAKLHNKELPVKYQSILQLSGSTRASLCLNVRPQGECCSHHS